MAKRVKIIVADDGETKDNVTYKKNVVMSIVSLATQEINGVASISRSAVPALKSALSRNINRGIIIEFDGNKAHIDVFINVLFGSSVKDVSFRVQENIKSSVYRGIKHNEWKWKYKKNSGEYFLWWNL